MQTHADRRAALAAATRRLEQRFLSGESVVELVHERVEPCERRPGPHDGRGEVSSGERAAGPREALGIDGSSGLVAIVGGGGKSSLMFALAECLPGRVVLTTTTRKQLFHLSRKSLRSLVFRFSCVSLRCPS